MRLQGLDPPLEMLRDLDRVSGIGRPSDEHHPNPFPGSVPLLDQLTENPAVVGIPHRVDRGSADSYVIGLIGKPTRPRVTVVGSDHHIGLVPPNSPGD